MPNNRDIIRRAALDRFIAEPDAIPALAAYRTSPSILTSVPISWLFPSAKRFRKAALSGPVLMSSASGPPELADAIATTVVPKIRKAARACRIFDFGCVPNVALKRASAKLKAAIACPHPYDEWIGIHEWEGGINGYLVLSRGSEGFEAIELKCIVNMENRATLCASDNAAAGLTETGDIMVATATQIPGLTGEECAHQASGNVVAPVLFMLAALADARCTRTPVRNFGYRVNAAPLLATVLDA